MSPISYVLRAHDLRLRQQELKLEQENPCPSSVQKKGGEENRRLKCFLKNNRKTAAVSPPPPSTTSTEQRSERLFITPKLERKEEDVMAQLLREHPPYPVRVWTKMQLINALVLLSPKKKASEFIKKVVELENTNYKNHSGIYKLFNK